MGKNFAKPTKEDENEEESKSAVFARANTIDPSMKRPGIPKVNSEFGRLG